MILCVSFLRSSFPTGLLIWLVAGVVAGIGLFIQGFRLLQRRHLILDTPFSKIRSASMGMVEVSGLAVGPYTMVSPITARPCYYYRTYVWEWKQNGKNKAWVKVAAECVHVPFFLDDNTGCVLIDPRSADLDIHRDFQEEFCDSFFTTKDPAPLNVRSFLARHGIETGNKIKVEEYCIKPKNALFILGTLAENPGQEVTPEPIHDDDAASLFSSHGFSLSFSTSRVSDSSLDDRSFLRQMAAISNDPQPRGARLLSAVAPSKASDSTQQQKIAAVLLRAGISNPAAWAAAGLGNHGIQVIEDPAVTDQASSGNGAAASSPGAKVAGFDSHPAVALMKGTNNKTFLISWRSQQDLARSLGWKCTLMIWCGPVLALLSLYLLLSITNLL